MILTPSEIIQILTTFPSKLWATCTLNKTYGQAVFGIICMKHCRYKDTECEDTSKIHVSRSSPVDNYRFLAHLPSSRFFRVTVLHDRMEQQLSWRESPSVIANAFWNEMVIGQQARNSLYTTRSPRGKGTPFKFPWKIQAYIRYALTDHIWVRRKRRKDVNCSFHIDARELIWARKPL